MMKPQSESLPVLGKTCVARDDDMITESIKAAQNSPGGLFIFLAFHSHTLYRAFSTPGLEEMNEHTTEEH